MANDKTPEQVARQLEIDAAKFGERVQVVFLKRAAIAMKADVNENFNTSASPDGAPWAPLRFPRPNSKGGDKPLLNTGLLRASITRTGAGHIENLTATSVEIGTVRPGANLMHAGGTVVPTKAKALAIPLTKEAYSATVNGGGPRKFPRPLFVLWKAGAKSGALAEVVQKGRGKKKKPTLIRHFALVKSVTVPARPFVGFGQRLVAKLESAFQAVVSEIFKESK